MRPLSAGPPIWVNRNSVARAYPRESASRTAIDNLLSHLGWITDATSPHCDVFTEGAKTREQAALLERKRPDYVLYEKDTDRPIAVIEAKRPGHTLRYGIEQAVSTHATRLGVNIVFATDGVLCETFDLRHMAPLLLDKEPVVDLLTPSVLLRFANDGPRLLTPTQTQQTKHELLSIFASANSLLRQEGLRAGVERFSEFANLLFLKLIAEIEQDREHKGMARRLPARYCWESFANKPPEEMLDYVNEIVLPMLVQNYNHSGDVFQPRLQINNANTLYAVVSRLSDLSLLNADTDVKGDAFEYFLKHSVTVGNDLGEYFTPRHIVNLIVDLIDPSYPEKVYDPCCGTGGFLIEAFRNIAGKVARTQETVRVLENETIYGVELTGTARIAKMNMILAGDGHTHIHQRDALHRKVTGRYNVVLTNFPFSQKTQYGHHYGLDTEDANPAFLKHAVEACVDGGRIGIVVPEGLLFRDTSIYESVRRYIIDKCSLEAVIALHDYVFRPYAGQPTAILIMTKGGHTKDAVWFYDVIDDGFAKNIRKKGRMPIVGSNNDLVRLRSIWSTKPTTDRSFAVPVSMIRDNSYRLSLSSYKGPTKTAQGYGRWTPLGDVCSIVLGGTPATGVPEYWDGEHPWVRISDMKDRYVTSTERTITSLGVTHSSVKLLPKDTVLLSFKLTIGRVAIAGRRLFTNEAIAGLIPRNKRLTSEYLYYVLQYLDLSGYMQPAAKGKTLNKKILKTIPIPIPSLKEQESFVKRMKWLEVKSDRLREQASEVDQDARDAGASYLARMGKL